MAKILVTGGLGFIGSHVVDKLLKESHEVSIIDNLSTGRLSNLSNSNKTKLYKLDILDNDLEECFAPTPTYIIHLAAQTNVNYSVKNPEKDAINNILSTIKLLKLSKKYKIKKFITASSAAVYGTPKYLPVDENHTTEPLSPYGLSKLTMEQYIKLSGIPYIIYRFSNAYGPRQLSSKEGGVISIFDNAMKNNKPIHIYGDGEQIRDFIYVEDIANIITKSITSDINNKILNFSTNKGITLNELFRKMKKIYNYKQNANYKPERIGDIKDSILDNSKMKQLFQFKDFTTIEEGLKRLKNNV